MRNRDLCLPRQEEDISNPNVVLPKPELADDEWQRSGDDRILQGAQQADHAQGGQDEPELQRGLELGLLIGFRGIVELVVR